MPIQASASVISSEIEGTKVKSGSVFRFLCNFCGELKTIEADILFRGSNALPVALGEVVKQHTGREGKGWNMNEAGSGSLPSLMFASSLASCRTRFEARTLAIVSVEEMEELEK